MIRSAATPEPRPPAQAWEEQGLAELVEEISRRIESGETVDLERYARQNPQFASQIQKLLPALEMLEEFGRSAGTRGEPGIAAVPMAAVPSQLVGDFRIIREIGRGGMGVVYQAEQVSLGRQVALKVLPFAGVLDPRQIQRFKNEAHAAAQLHHSNIVPVYSVGCERGVHYYAMQYIEGQSLETVIDELQELTGTDKAACFAGEVSVLTRQVATASLEPEVPGDSSNSPGLSAIAFSASPAGRRTAKPLKGVTPAQSRGSQAFFRTVAGLGVQAADALQHAHDLGVVHRDIKPSNLLLDFRGNLWVTDFGLAHCQGGPNLTISGDLLGTLRYMSPEQALAKRAGVDHRTDIYSLGATLYEVLTLQPVFGGQDRKELIRQIMFEEPKPLRKLNRAVPEDLQTIVLRAVEKDPLSRYATARELADDLRRYLEDRPILARRPSALHRALRWTRRRRWPVAAAAVISLLLAVAGFLALRDYREYQEAAYRKQVRDSVLKLHQGLITALQRPGNFAPLNPTFMLVRGDLQKMLGGSQVDPLQDALEQLEQAGRALPGRPESHYHRARGLLLIPGRDEEARQALRAALQRDPDFVPARLTLATLLGREGKAREAIAELERAGGLGRTPWAEKWLRAYRALAEGRWKEAAGFYGSLIEEESASGELYLGSSIETRLLRGLARLEDGDHLGALEDFFAARALWPHFLETDLLIGKTLFVKGEEAGSEEVFRRLWESSPTRDATALQIAAVYYDLDEFGKGLAWLERMLPGAIRERNRAYFLFRLLRYREAEEAGKNAIRENPQDTRALHYVATIYFHLRRYDEALALLTRAIELDPKDHGLYSNLGWVLEAQDKREEARRAYLRSLELSPKHSFPRVNLAYILEEEGKVAEALEGMKEAVELARRYPFESFTRSYAQRGLARVLFRLGRHEEAMRALGLAIELNPRSPENLVTLGRFNLLLGRSTEALAGFRKAVALNAEDPSVNTSLGMALEVQDLRGNFQEAFGSYLKAIEVNPSYLEAQRRLTGMLLQEDEPARIPELDALVHALEEAAASPGANPVVLTSVAVVLTRSQARRDPGRALVHASLAVERTAREDPAALAVLALANSARGEKRGAVLLLEEALRLPRATRAMLRLLENQRRAVLPEVVSYASVDAALEDTGGIGEDKGVHSALRPPAGEASADRLALYLEGRSRQQAGRHGGAVESFRMLMAVDRESCEPVLRLAGSLRALERTEEAEEVLREAIPQRPGEEVKDSWLRISLVDLKRSPGEILARFPPAADGHAEDLRWLLGELQAGRPIRLNCGGSDHQSPEGTSWSRDRFHRGGLADRPFEGEISGSDDDPLYRTGRYFPAEEVGSGYRIPLPPGEYRITLHFAELWLPRRTFRVLLEGEEVLRDFNPLHAGFATAQERSFAREVDDGFLEIDFISQFGDPNVSAIEVERRASN